MANNKFCLNFNCLEKVLIESLEGLEAMSEARFPLRAQNFFLAISPETNLNNFTIFHHFLKNQVALIYI